MPIHDWRRVKNTGLFHHVHVMWVGELCRTLNGGGLPPGYYALAEQRSPQVEPDVLALHVPARSAKAAVRPGGIAMVEDPPRARIIRHLDDAAVYAAKANRIVIREEEGSIVAVIELVSPGNKASADALREFVSKVADFLRNGIHVLIVDLFPPTRRDPRGIHKAIWDTFVEEPFDPPADKPLTVASYDAWRRVAYVDPVAVGDELPDAPLFLESHGHVPVPLERTYMSVIESCPEPLRDALDPDTP